MARLEQKQHADDQEDAADGEECEQLAELGVGSNPRSQPPGGERAADHDDQPAAQTGPGQRDECQGQTDAAGDEIQQPIVPGSPPALIVHLAHAPKGPEDGHEHDQSCGDITGQFTPEFFAVREEGGELDQGEPPACEPWDCDTRSTLTSTEGYVITSRAGNSGGGMKGLQRLARRGYRDRRPALRAVMHGSAI
ncbi:MAG: hypothetical protein AMS25_00275 [Gemmatimonas sp. SM23_52]|nr:MAG: hypothetical protein AMS25_00275 [Gemmatimonas sp. SM23_52]